MVIKKIKTQTKILLLALLFMLVLALVVAVLEVTNITHYFHKAAVVSAPSKPFTTVTMKNQVKSSEKTPSGGSAISQGTSTDKNGQAPISGVSNDPSQWSTSASRLITLKAPIRNSTLQSGSIITGSTTVSNQVQYRLVDSRVGVIAQGSIKVINGIFTAAIIFIPHSDRGKLDVFSTDSGGNEANEVQIHIKF
jgi:hypothetical protein